MDKSENIYKNHSTAIVFDHDGTLVDTRGVPVLFPGIEKLLTDLSSRQVDLYLWSLRPRASLVRITKELAIYNYFRDLRGSDDGHNPKPHPEGLRDLLFGYEYDKVCHVGDGVGDFSGASALKIPFIAACWIDPSYGKDWEKVQLQYPDMRIVTKPGDILKALEELGILKN